MDTLSIDRISVIRSVTEELFTALGFEERLRRILEIAMRSADAEGGTIFLHDPASNSLVFRYVVGERANELIGKRIDADMGKAGKVLRSGEAELTPNAESDTEVNRQVGASIGRTTRDLITVPLRSHGEPPLGVMQVVNKRHGTFNEEDKALLEVIADVAAMALRNAELARDAELAHLGQTLGSLSHDLKNKVFAIVGWLDTIGPEIDEVRDKAPEAYPNILEALSAIRGAATDVHHYTKLIADAVRGTVSEINLQPTNFSDMAEQAVARKSADARMRGVKIVPDIEPTDEAMMDRVYINSLLENLIHNAIEAASPTGTVFVTVRQCPPGAFLEGDCAMLEVKDTGKGMPDHKLQEILEGRAVSSKANGSGLGTRIIRKAILAHGGRWEGESEEGSGTTFRIRLPLRPAI